MGCQLKAIICQIGLRRMYCEFGVRELGVGELENGRYMQWGQTIQTIGWQIQNVILNLSNIVVEIDSGVMYNIGYENYNVNLCGNPLHESTRSARLKTKE